MKRYPYLASTIQDFEYDLPLRASPDDLSHVITAIANRKDDFDWPTSASVSQLDRTAFDDKNTINGLSAEYAKLITGNYLKHFAVIEAFLADPINEGTFQAYRDAVDEFSAKLVVHRQDFETFDKQLDHLLSGLIERDSDLRSNKRLTRTVFYFMYWTCDIGETAEEAHAEAD